VKQKYGNNSPERDESCTHHWIIDVKNVGICKKCGDKHQFCSTWEQFTSGKIWTRSYRGAKNSSPGSGQFEKEVG